MKPCSRNRKNIALLAANALDASAAGKLREHIATCAGCRDYLSEISDVASELFEVHETSEIEASGRFHQRLVGRIRATDPLANTAAAYLARLKWHVIWRIIVPVTCVAMLAGIAIGLSFNSNHVSRPQTTVKPDTAADAGAGDISPTLANYQNAANRSFEQLDSLLTRQSKVGPPPAQIYRASAIALAQGPL